MFFEPKSFSVCVKFLRQLCVGNAAGSLFMLLGDLFEYVLLFQFQGLCNCKTLAEFLCWIFSWCISLQLLCSWLLLLFYPMSFGKWDLSTCLPMEGECSKSWRCHKGIIYLWALPGPFSPHISPISELSSCSRIALWGLKSKVLLLYRILHLSLALLSHSHILNIKVVCSTKAPL